MEETIEKIKKYVLQLNKNIEDIDFKVGEMIDRVLAYTRRNSIPIELERIIARTIVSLENDRKSLETSENGEIATVSDNGQSISFKSKADSRQINKSELDILEGIRPILDNYKLAKVFKEDEITK